MVLMESCYHAQLISSQRVVLHWNGVKLQVESLRDRSWATSVYTVH